MRRTAMTTAVAARTSGPTRTHTGAEGSRHHRAAGPHARGKRSWQHDHSFRTFWTAGSEHAVVMTERVILPGDEGAGEEDDRDDENSPSDDHDPRRSLVEPRGPRNAWWRRRTGRWRTGGWRLEMGLGCLSHPTIMPTSAPAIKHRTHKAAECLPF